MKTLYEINWHYKDRERDGGDRDDWHWVLIPKEDIEEFVRQVTEEAAT